MRARSIILLGLVLISLTFAGYVYYNGAAIGAGSSPVAWVNAYAGNTSGYGKAILQAGDNGFIIAGSATLPDSSDEDVTLIKTDANGSLQWQRSYGGDKADHGNSIIGTAGGGYVVVGDTASFGNGSRDIYLLKADSNGSLLWAKAFGGTKADEGLAIRRSSDGGHIIAGYTESFGNGSMDIYVVKTSSTGELEWSRTYGGPYDDIVTSIEPVRGGGYIISGSYGVSQNRHVAYLLKIDNWGRTIWENKYDIQNNGITYHARQTKDRGYIAVGYSNPIQGTNHILLLKTGPDGNVTWQKYIGGYATQNGHMVYQMPDDGYLIIGEAGVTGNASQVRPNVQFEGLVIRTNATGDVEWQGTYGADRDVFIHSGIPTKDGGLALAGAISKKDDPESRDIYLLKLGNIK